MSCFANGHRKAGRGEPLAALASVQVRLARAAADLDAAELLLRRAVDAARSPHEPSLELRARTMREVRGRRNCASASSTR